jgi:hypothetical protein
VRIYISINNPHYNLFLGGNMVMLPEVIRLLTNLGFKEIKPGKWRTKKDDYGWIYLDFNKNLEGIASAWSKYEDWLPVEIVEEMSPIAEFRKRYLEIKKGVPMSFDELNGKR